MPARAPTRRDSTRDVRARTGPLYTRDVGDGQAVLLLHAFPLNSRMWEPQFASLGTRARLLAPDLPGCGLSPAAPEVLSLDGYAREVLGVLDALGIERVVIVGLSMGGYLAFRMVEQLGARLLGLLLADTKAIADTSEAARTRHELAAEVEADGVDVAASEFLPKLLGQTTQRLRPQLIDQVRAVVQENTPAGLAAALRAMASRPDSTPLLLHLRCPVRCVVGAEDTLTPPEVVRAMAEQIPDAPVDVILEAGHLTNLEAPEAFNDAVLTLLAQATSVGPGPASATRRNRRNPPGTPSAARAHSAAAPRSPTRVLTGREATLPEGSSLRGGGRPCVEMEEWHSGRVEVVTTWVDKAALAMAWNMDRWFR